jgi:hypothetical protein
MAFHKVVVITYYNIMKKYAYNPHDLINFSKKFPKFLKRKFQGIPLVSPKS